MNNLQSHVREHGHLTFGQNPFGVLDSLALAHIVYMPMEGFWDRGGDATIRELWFFLSLRYLDAFPTHCLRKCYFFTQVCAAAERYAHLKIIDYQNDVDKDQETQFCACTFLLPDGSRLIAFRGTDLSIAGWKEDLNMAFMTVPAQRKAVEYAARAAAAFSGPLIFSGHSKGGSLALYAACHTTDAIRSRITQVYSFDGPGVSKATLDGPGYRAVRGRVQSWLPQNSVVGMLLNYHPDYHVVKSTASGLMQHDAFTWVIRNGRFEELKEMNLSSRTLGEAFCLWLDQRTEEERRFLVDVIFHTVSSIGKDDVRPLIENPLGSTSKMIAVFGKLDFETQVKVTRLLASIVSNEADYTIRQLLSGSPKPRSDSGDTHPKP